MKLNKKRDFPLAAIAAALLAAYGPVWAQTDDEVKLLTRPTSSIALGTAYLSKDAPRFGLYSGMKDEGLYGVLDFNIIRLDEATGTWLKFNGRNLGLESRDLRVTHERQGDWAYSLDYSETTRHEPRSVTTAVRGIGTANLIVPNTSTPGSALSLKMKREATGLTFSKQLGGGFEVLVKVRNEEKDGARLFARGESGGMEFTPEPINSTTRQLDTTLGYTNENLHLNVGYYGSAYDNHSTALNIAGGTTLALRTTHNLIALPPDNESHQLHVGGGYKFSPTTKGTFKVAYARATQNSTFITSVPVATDLGARVDTTRAQFGVSSRPLPKLSLLANFNYDDRDDKTPVRRFATVVVPGTSTFTGQNEPRSMRTTSGKLEASYLLPMAMRVTGGFDYVEKDRNSYPVRVTGYREKTEEASYRMVLQRSMSETVSGSIEYVHSNRHGSPYLASTMTNLANNPVQAITPIHLMDRQRDKVRLSASWTPSEELSLQFALDESRDDYGHRTAAQMGLREGRANNISVDATYSLSDDWQANAWVSRNATRLDQAGGGVANAPALTPLNTAWLAALTNNGKSVGIGLRGKMGSKFDVGVDLSHSEVIDAYRMQLLTSGAPISAAPPSYFTRQSSLKAFTKYAVDKNAIIRFDYIYDRFSTNDWTWSTLTNPTTWTYSDGTQISQRQRQNAHLVGVTYIYRFQ